MFCGVALSPAMIAAGSPGARCSSRKTKTATTAITGTIESSRRTMYPPTVYDAVPLPPLAGEGRDGGRRTRDATGVPCARLPPPQPSPAGGGGKKSENTTGSDLFDVPPRHDLGHRHDAA